MVLVLDLNQRMPARRINLRTLTITIMINNIIEINEIMEIAQKRMIIGIGKVGGTFVSTIKLNSIL